MDEEPIPREAFLEDLIDFGSQETKSRRLDTTQASFRHSTTTWTQSGQNLTQNWMAFTQTRTQSGAPEATMELDDQHSQPDVEDDCFLEEIFGDSSKKTSSRTANQQQMQIWASDSSGSQRGCTLRQGFFEPNTGREAYHDHSQGQYQGFIADSRFIPQERGSHLASYPYHQALNDRAPHDSQDSKSSSGVLSWFNDISDSPIKHHQDQRDMMAARKGQLQSKKTDREHNSKGMTLIEQDLARLDDFFRNNTGNHHRHQLPISGNQGPAGNWPTQFAGGGFGSSFNSNQNQICLPDESLRQQPLGQGIPQIGWNENPRLEHDANMQAFFKYSLTGDSSSTGAWVDAHTTPRLLPALSKLAQCMQHLLSKLGSKQTVYEGAKHLVTSHRLTDGDLKSFLGYGKISVCKASPKDVLDKIVGKTVLFLVLRKSADGGLPPLGRQLLDEGFRALLLL